MYSLRARGDGGSAELNFVVQTGRGDSTVTKADAETQTATVTPDAAKAPSPKALWEAVEKAGYKPTKLVGPAGTFSAKPSS